MDILLYTKSGGGRSLVVMGVFCLLGCSATIEPPTNFVKQHWVESLEPLGIQPVYPPTEDIHVGDIYATTSKKRQSYARLDSFKIGYADPWVLIQEKYSKYVKLPSSEIEKSKPEKRYILQKPLQYDRKFDRLPLVAFPGYTLAVYNAAEFAATAPLQNLAIFLGISSKSVESVALSVKEVETYGLDAYQALKLFSDYCERKDLPSDEFSHYSTTASPCDQKTIESAQSRLSDGPTQPLEPMMVSRVYMTRSIQYTFRGDNVFGLSAGVGVTLSQAVANQKKLQGLLKDATIQKSDRQTDGGGANPTHGEDVTNQANQALNELGASLNDLAKSQIPQSRFSFVSADSRGVTLEETFERPLVIGYEGMFLTPASNSGDNSAVGKPPQNDSEDAEKSKSSTRKGSQGGTPGTFQVK